MPPIATPVEQLRELLPKIDNMRDLAVLFEVPFHRFVYHVKTTDNSSSYLTYQVAKRAGGVRLISAPSGGLKLLQQKVAYIVGALVRSHSAAHGFVKERGIVTNARAHLRSRYVLNLDLKDFFPTISFRRVRGMFIARPFGLHPHVATCLARIACRKGHLPMGSPCSPVIANILCRRLDQQVKELCKSLGCWYTRYADDISISTRLDKFPHDIAYEVEAPDRRIVLSPRLIATIQSNGFEVQEAKTRLLPRRTRQLVTGVIVNRKLGLDRRRKNQLRAMLHAWEKFGYAAAEREFHEKYDKKHRPHFKVTPKFRNVIAGKLAYLSMVLGKEHLLVRAFSTKLETLVAALPN